MVIKLVVITLIKSDQVMIGSCQGDDLLPTSACLTLFSSARMLCFGSTVINIDQDYPGPKSVHS